MNRFIHFIVLLAFLTVGISPACQFISGRMVDVEICTPDGLEMIKVAESQSPEPAKQAPQEQRRDDCGFCFAQSHLKLAKAVSVSVPVTQFFSEETEFPVFADFHFNLPANSSQPRAPPVSVLI